MKDARLTWKRCVVKGKLATCLMHEVPYNRDAVIYHCAFHMPKTGVVAFQFMVRGDTPLEDQELKVSRLCDMATEVLQTAIKASPPQEKYYHLDRAARETNIDDEEAQSVVIVLDDGEL